MNRALLHLEAKRYAAALADLDAAAGPAADEPLRQVRRGVALEGLGRPADADAAFRAGRDAAAGPPAVRRQMEWAFGFAVAARRPADARAAFDAVLRDDPDNGQALYGLAMLAMAAGDDAAALGHFNRALAAAPGFHAARRYRAVLRARAGDLDRAGDDINWCLERDPRSGDTLYAAACVAALALARRDDPRLGDQAAELMARAFARGVGPDKAAADPDLAAVRHVPRFRALLGGAAAD